MEDIPELLITHPSVEPRVVELIFLAARERLTGFLVLSVFFKLLPFNVSRGPAPAHQLPFVRLPHLSCALRGEHCTAAAHAHGMRRRTGARVFDSIRVDRSTQLLP